MTALPYLRMKLNDGGKSYYLFFQIEITGFSHGFVGLVPFVIIIIRCFKAFGFP